MIQLLRIVAILIILPIIGTLGFVLIEDLTGPGSFPGT
jgi:hypothetical protein